MPITPPRRLRIGLIGAGAIGAWHARIVAERADAELSAVADIDGLRGRALADKYGASAFADAAAMFAALALDGVIIASPERAHVEHAALAAKARTPMLIEKPVAADLAGVEEIRRLAEEAGVAVTAGHVERFELGSAQLKTALDQGICGRVSVIAARRQFVAVDAPRFTGLSTTLRVLGVHDFDLVTWLHPARIRSVYAAAARGGIFDATGLDDHVVTTIAFEDGAIALVESGWTLPSGYGVFETPRGWSPAGNNRLDVFGDKGLLSNDMGLRNQQLIALDTAEGLRAAGLRHQPILHGRVVGALAEQTAAFLCSIASGTMPIVGLDDAARAIAMTGMAEQSLRLGRPVFPEAA